MNRRDFLRSAGVLLVGAAIPTGVVALIHETHHEKWHVRPQRTVEDLEAEMKAWVGGDEDDHDKVISQYKLEMWERYGRPLMKRRYEAFSRAPLLPCRTCRGV